MIWTMDLKMTQFSFWKPNQTVGQVYKILSHQVYYLDITWCIA